MYTPTEDLPHLIEKAREGYDMVIASRYLPPAKSEDDGLITGFGNWLFTRTVNLLHGGRYTDAMTIFRIYRTALFPALGCLESTGTQASSSFRLSRILAISLASRSTASG